jgi:hypothetical protein
LADALRAHYAIRHGAGWMIAQARHNPLVWNEFTPSCPQYVNIDDSDWVRDEYRQ